jgi:hypothetical protein
MTGEGWMDGWMVVVMMMPLFVINIIIIIVVVIGRLHGATVFRPWQYFVCRRSRSSSSRTTTIATSTYCIVPSISTALLIPRPVSPYPIACSSSHCPPFLRPARTLGSCHGFGLAKSTDHGLITGDFRLRTGPTATTTRLDNDDEDEYVHQDIGEWMWMWRWR